MILVIDLGFCCDFLSFDWNCCQNVVICTCEFEKGMSVVGFFNGCVCFVVLVVAQGFVSIVSVYDIFWGNVFG